MHGHHHGLYYSERHVLPYHKTGLEEMRALSGRALSDLVLKNYRFAYISIIIVSDSFRIAYITELVNFIFPSFGGYNIKIPCTHVTHTHTHTSYNKYRWGTKCVLIHKLFHVGTRFSYRRNKSNQNRFTRYNMSYNLFCS